MLKTFRRYLIINTLVVAFLISGIWFSYIWSYDHRTVDPGFSNFEKAPHWQKWDTTK